MMKKVILKFLQKKPRAYRVLVHGRDLNLTTEPTAKGFWATRVVEAADEDSAVEAVLISLKKQLIADYGCNSIPDQALIVDEVETVPLDSRRPDGFTFYAVDEG